MNMKKDIVQWCQGRNGFVRLPLLIWFICVLIRHLRDPHYQSLLGAINLGIHELGHMVFSFGGEFLTIAGGTVLQCLVPLYGVYNFLKQKDYFASALCFGWLSTNFFNVATYAGDAQAMALPLVTPFGLTPSIAHDWNYLLTQMGLLAFDGWVAFFFRFLGVLSMGICLFAGGWMVALMMKNSFRIIKNK